MSNVVKSKGSIYSLAKRARERLKNNSYSREFKGKTINNATSFANYIYQQKKEDALKVPPKEKKTSYEEELYKRVCNIIESQNT